MVKKNLKEEDVEEIIIAMAYYNEKEPFKTLDKSMNAIGMLKIYEKFDE